MLDDPFPLTTDANAELHQIHPSMRANSSSLPIPCFRLIASSAVLGWAKELV
jgi:O6-methylguanine-DNA--protein-cysteine methyltransferase